MMKSKETKNNRGVKIDAQYNKTIDFQCIVGYPEIFIMYSQWDGITFTEIAI